MKFARVLPVLPALLLLCAAGCSSKRYVTPGLPADMSLFATTDVEAAMLRQPEARLPTALAVIRVQGPGYKSYSTRGYGNGGYSVVTRRDLERENDFARLVALPGISTVVHVNRLLLPAELGQSKDIRLAAAQLRAEVVLVYTLDTHFHVDERVRPGAVITLGLLPNRLARVQSLCSALLIDTRSGFIYGTAEGEASESKRANVWSSEQAVEDSRRKAERAAFENALAELELLWPEIAAAHQPFTR